MRAHVLLLASLAAGCGGGSRETPPKSPAVIAKTPRAAEPTEQLPPIGEVRSLESLVPATVSVALGLPSLDDVTAALLAGLAGDLARASVAERAGIDPEAFRLLLASSDGCVLLLRGEQERGAIVRVRDPAVADEVARLLALHQAGPDTWRRPRRYAGTGGVATLDRFAQAGVLVVTTDERLRASILERASGRGAAFARSRPEQSDPSELWLALDLAAFWSKPEVLAPGSRLEASLSPESFSLDFAQRGERVPRVGDVLAPGALVALGKLPEGALAGVGFSIRRLPPKTIRDVLTELGRTANEDWAELAERLLGEHAQRSLADLERALGDEVAIAVYGPGQAPGQARSETPRGDLAVVATIEARDPRVATQLVRAFQKATARPHAATARRPNGGRSVDVVAQDGRVFIVAGPSSFVPKLLKSALKPVRTLDATDAFRSSSAGMAEPVHARGFVDLAAVASLMPPEALQSPAPKSADTVRFGSLTFRPTDDGLAAVFRSPGRRDAAKGIGVLASAAVYGVRRYLTDAKVVEAKNTLGAIARSAVTAFEREQAPAPGAPITALSAAVHTLCETAQPVPAFVPKGARYQPRQIAGADFQSGTATAGWRCMKFEIAMPHAYQYEYRRGGPYKGPARGGPDAGPTGFEISAEGDLDGDGETSLFTIVGRIDAATDTVRLSEMFISDEHE